ACGIPVITSNISSMPEVAGNAAIQVNPYKVNEIAEAMEGICSNRDLRKDLVAKGLKNVKRFSWEKTAEKTLSVYEEVFLDGTKRKN
ncbi:glycosyltransferase family 1 protein, partial [bacterium]|nr:glycosyltransferase family 1 protein [bacterium]